MVAKKKVIDIKDAKTALGADKIEEIVSKEWKTAELPPDKAIEEEVHDSPKARSNVNSRKNLIQYKKDKPVEVKEAIVNNLKFKSTREDPKLDVLFEGVLSKEMVSILLPMRDALADEDEEEVFFGTIKFFVKDFPKDELSASDIDDIANLALNRILELRMLKAAKETPKRILDVAASIERFRKNSEKIKMGLASRRMDRVDTKNKSSFSIVDIANQFDENRRKALEDRVEKFRLEDAEFADKKNRGTPDQE